MSVQTVRVSGFTEQAAVSQVIITYEQPQQPYGLPEPNPTRNQDVVPGFMYLMGAVVYEKDQFGNMIARNRSRTE